MFFKKKQTQLERVLHEYPWMWAIQPFWSPGNNNIYLYNINIDDLYCNFVEGDRWWIVCKTLNNGIGSYEEVREVKLRSGFTLAELILETSCLDITQIRYLVKNKNDPPVDISYRKFAIYRPPYGLLFVDVCNNVKSQVERIGMVKKEGFAGMSD